MIGHLARAVAADLRRRKFPHPVRYSPERAGRGSFDHAILFARDREAGDKITAPAGAKDRNPEVIFNRHVAGVVTVYARSSKAGATIEDHEDECDAVCDGVLTAMRRILVARRLPFAVIDSRLLSREDLRDEDDAGDDRSGHRSADWPGCAARIRFAVGSAVRDVTYPGAAQSTGVVDDVDCPVVTADGFDDYDPAPGPPEEP